MLRILLNNFRNLFIFCIKVDIDEMLLLDKIRAYGLITLELFSFVILEKAFMFLLLISLYLFIICINVDIDELLLLEKNKDLGGHFFFWFFLKSCFGMTNPCTVKSTHPKVFREAIWYFADSL